MTQTPITQTELDKLVELNKQGVDGLMAKHVWDKLTDLVGKANLSDKALQGMMLHTLAQWVNYWMIGDTPSDLGKAFNQICDRIHVEFGLDSDTDKYCQAGMVFNELLNQTTVPYFKSEGYYVDQSKVVNAGLTLCYKMAGVINSYQPQENRLTLCLDKLLEENNK